MAFLTATELNTHIYDYQLAQITENDLTIANTAIQAAIAEVKLYIGTRYDTATIFSQTGDSRNQLILDITKTVAVYKIIRLANPDIIYERYHDAYTEAISLLKAIASGNISGQLPRITVSSGSGGGSSSGCGSSGGGSDTDTDTDTDSSTYYPLQILGNKKFTHDF